MYEVIFPRWESRGYLRRSGYCQDMLRRELEAEEGQENGYERC